MLTPNQQKLRLLEKELSVLETSLYGPWGTAAVMKNRSRDSERYKSAKKKFDEDIVKYNRVKEQVNTLTAKENEKAEKDSAAKKTEDKIKSAKERLTKADSKIKLASDLQDSAMYDEALTEREDAASVLTNNNEIVPPAPKTTVPANSNYKPKEREVANEPIDSKEKYADYTINTDGTVTGPGAKPQYLVTIKNPETGNQMQKPYTDIVDARNAFVKEYYSGPNGAEQLKADLKAKGFITDEMLRTSSWYEGIDDFIRQYTIHAITQVKYGQAENSDEIASYLKTVSGDTGKGPKTTRILTTRGDAKKDLDKYLMDLIGRGSTLEEQEDYFLALNKAQNESTMTTQDGNTTGRYLQDSDRLLLVAKVAKKALKGSNINEILSSKKGSQVAVDITEMQRLASDYGIPMNAVEAMKYVRAGLGQTDTLKKQEERLRQLSMTVHPYLKEHLTAGGTVKDVADYYAQTKTQKLGVVVPDSTADKDVMAALRSGKTIDQFGQEMQGRPEWRFSDEARQSATQFANTILSSFGFGG